MRPDLDPVLMWLSLAVVLAGCLVIGMVLTVIVLHVRALRQATTRRGRRLLVWHVVLISIAHVCFVLPIVIGVLGTLGVIPTNLLALRIFYLSGLGFSVAALVAVAIRIRPKPKVDIETPPTGQHALKGDA